MTFLDDYSGICFGRYYEILDADHITYIIDKDRAGVKFDVLYDSIFERCRKQMQRTVSRRRERAALSQVVAEDGLASRGVKQNSS